MRRLAALLPQQAIVPSVLMPQVKSCPALTAVYVPAVTVVWPDMFRPQQVSAPALLSAQLCEPPALIALKDPDGDMVRLLRLSPQQEIAPALRMAQVTLPAAAANVLDCRCGVWRSAYTYSNSQRPTIWRSA